MPESLPTDFDPTAHAEWLYNRYTEALANAVRCVSPETPDADPLEIFPAPNEVRAEDPGLVLSPDQETELRSLAAELGFGRRNDRGLTKQGLTGATVIFEGGQPHKIQAEIDAVQADQDAHPTMLVFAASPHRKLTNSAEQASAERLLGSIPETEFDTAMELAQRMPGFIPSAPLFLPFSYDINDNNRLTRGTESDFIVIGHRDNVPVMMLAIKREDYTDEETGKPAYRKQPSTAEVIKIAADVTAMMGDSGPIAFLTSATYEPSRTVDAARAALLTGRPTGIATYGTDRLDAVTGNHTAEKPLYQLPGELHKTAQTVRQLGELLASRR